MGHKVIPESSQGHAALEPAQRHAALERYLRLATWGLWGRKKLEVRRELEGNIQELALEFQMAGCPREEAISRALEEFGPPEKVSQGMNKIYTLPRLLRNSVLMTALASVTIGVLNSSAAQITNTTRFPIPECQNSQQAQVKIGAEVVWCEGGLWFFVPSLRALLEPQNVKFEEYISKPNGERRLAVRFPGATSMMLLDLPGGNTPTFQTGQGQPLQFDWNYVDAYSFIRNVTTVGVPVTFTGWRTTKLVIGTTELMLPNAEGDAKWLLHSIFAGLITAKVGRGGHNQGFLTKDPNLDLSGWGKPSQSYTIRVNETKPDDMFLVLSRRAVTAPLQGQITDLFGNSIDDIATSHLVTVGTGGDFQTQFPAAINDLEFISDPTALQGMKEAARGQAVLYKFNGRLDVGAKALEIVLPDQITIEK